MAPTWKKILLDGDGSGYTDTMARAACIAATISDNDLTHSPDGNSVFDALALKAPIASPTFTGIVTMNSSVIIPDGGTIGQAAGPLLAFDDTNNYLEITGCKVGIGTTTPISILNLVAETSLAINIDSYASIPASGIVGRCARGTLTNPLNVIAGNVLFNFGGIGYGTTGFSTYTKAKIEFIAEEIWSDTTQGTYITFKTTTSGGTSFTEKMRIKGDGNVGIGTTTPLAKLAINGGVNVGADSDPGDNNLDVAGTLKVGTLEYFNSEIDNGNSGTADTINWNAGNYQKSTLTGNCTFTFTAPLGPCSLLLKLTQDATGSRLVTWPATVLFPGNVHPTLSTGANKVDICTFYFDGTNYFGSWAVNYS